MNLELRPATAVGVLVVVLVVGSLGSAAIGQVGGGVEYDPHGDFVEMYEDPETGETTLIWGYTSRATTFGARTLALNVVVMGDVEETRNHLEDTSRGDWNETDGDFEDEGFTERYVRPNGTATAWGHADGSTRYTYVTDRGGGTDEGTWLTESYQLHDGDYLGSRHHIRAYAAPASEEEWTAMQAHREHWDWFRLRHTVDSIEESQRYVEGEFMGRWFVDDVYRTHAGNDYGADSDGWLTVVEIVAEGTEGADEDDGPVGSIGWTLWSTLSIWATIGGTVLGGTVLGGTVLGGALLGGALLGGTVLSGVVLGGPIVRGREVHLLDRVDESMGTTARRVLVLASAVVALFLAVRFAAIGLERATPLPPRLIAAALYPVVFAGLPVVTYLLARQIDRHLAFTGASLGFLTAVLLDYTYLGVSVLPLEVLIHRGGLAVALGFVAIGASRPERLDPTPSSHLQLGVLLWLVALVLPLLRFV